jgi:hypothetical protein
MNEAQDGQQSLLARIQRMLNTREIPRVTSSTSAEPKTCDACGQPIPQGRSQYEIGFSTLTFRLDALCFRVWTEEMLRKHRKSKVRRSGAA